MNRGTRGKQGVGIGFCLGRVIFSLAPSR